METNNIQRHFLISKILYNVKLRFILKINYDYIFDLDKCNFFLQDFNYTFIVIEKQVEAKNIERQDIIS